MSTPPRLQPSVAIGSTNPAKVKAVQSALKPVWPDAHIVPVAVNSGVSPMPLTDQEGRAGALHRARAARAEIDADYGVGLEGAVDDDAGEMYLTNWVAIVDRTGRVGFACGGRFPLPESIAREIRAGSELGPLIDRYMGSANTKHGGGAAGFLTKGAVPRALPFQVAVGLALAPFMRPELYDHSEEPC